MYFDKEFNLIIDVNNNVQASVKPITRKFFESHYKVFSELASRFSQQTNTTGALLIEQTAILDLRDIADEEESKAIESEILRTTLVAIHNDDKVKKPLSLEIAFEKGHLDEDDYRKALNVTLFFTVLLLLVPSKDTAALNSFLESSSMRSTSLNYTDYLKSLGTSKQEETIEEKEKTFSL